MHEILWRFHLQKVHFVMDKCQCTAMGCQEQPRVLAAHGQVVCSRPPLSPRSSAAKSQQGCIHGKLLLRTRPLWCQNVVLIQVFQEVFFFSVTYFSRYVEDRWQWWAVEDCPGHCYSCYLEEKKAKLLNIKVFGCWLEKRRQLKSKYTIAENTSLKIAVTAI